MSKTIVAVTLWVLLSACGGDPLYQQTVNGLQGSWQAPCQENPPDMNGQVTYARARFTYGATGEGAFRYTLYGDAACSYQLAEFLIESDVTLGAELPAVTKGTYEMDVAYRKVSATAFVDGFVQGFGYARCGTEAWKIGVRQDISTTGCFNFKPISQCPADYDVARVDGDRFFSGAREADMCVAAGRPKRLADFAFERVK